MIAGAAAGAAERVDWIGTRRKPCWCRAEDETGHERQREGERQDHRRGTRLDRHEGRSRKREGDEQPRRADRDEKPGDPAEHREEDALDERLRDDLPPRCAERKPHRGLPAPRHGTRQQQVRHIGTRDQEHQPAHAEQNLQAASVLLSHDADTGASRHDRHDLVRQRLDDGRHPVRRVSGVVLNPLMENAGQPRPHAVDRCARPQPADDAQPGGHRLPQDRRVTIDHRLLLQRNPHVRRIAAERFAEKSRRRHTDDGERTAFDVERRSDDRRVTAVSSLPDVMAEHDHGLRRRRVVGGVEHAAPERADAKRREVVAGDELGADRPRRRVAILASYAQAHAAGLERRHFFELRHLRLQALEQRERDHPPAILWPALYAAGVAIADAVEACRIADRQRAQHHRVDEREDGRGATDAECQRQHCGGREDPCDPELPQRVAEFADECAQRRPLLSFLPVRRPVLDGGQGRIVATRPVTPSARAHVSTCSTSARHARHARPHVSTYVSKSIHPAGWS